MNSAQFSERQSEEIHNSQQSESAAPKPTGSFFGCGHWMSKIILSIFINRAFPHTTPTQLRRASSHQSTSEHSGHQQGTPGWPGTTPWNPQQSNFRLRLLNVKGNLIYIHAAPLRHETTKALLKALPLLVSLDSLRPLSTL